MKNTFFIQIFIALLLSWAVPAHAYLDPGTGSLLLQGAIAAIAAITYTVKIYWYRIRAFLKGEKWVAPVLDSEMDSPLDTELESKLEAPAAAEALSDVNKTSD